MVGRGGGGANKQNDRGGCSFIFIFYIYFVRGGAVTILLFMGHF